MAELTGLTKEQTHNLGWLAVLHPEDAEGTMKKLREELRAGKPIDIEYRVKGVDRGWRGCAARNAKTELRVRLFAGMAV